MISTLLGMGWSEGHLLIPHLILDHHFTVEDGSDQIARFLGTTSPCCDVVYYSSKAGLYIRVLIFFSFLKIVKKSKRVKGISIS
jgi:hypothetical protein